MTANRENVTITANRTFQAALDEAVQDRDSLLCVGLDPDLSRMPAAVVSGRSTGAAIVEFNRQIIDATIEFACAFKPNLAFYLQFGVEGYQALLETRSLIPESVPTILDCKIGDIASTMEPLARAYLDRAGFDAVTVNPYLGSESLAPLFGRAGKGLFVLCKTSNPGSAEVQNLELASGQPLYKEIASKVRGWRDLSAATLGLVAGATYPTELRAIRELAPELLLLLPGIGSQAGDLAVAVRAGLDDRGAGILVNASRSISYASNGSDFARAAARAARTMRNEINAIRQS